MALLHKCELRDGYFAPRALAKLLDDSVQFGSLRQESIDWFYKFLCDAVVSCGRCGARMKNAVWSRGEIARWYDFADATDRDQLEEVICSYYDERVLTCAACNHTAHLAWDG